MRTASHRKPGLNWGIAFFTYGDQEFTYDTCATAKIARLDNATEIHSYCLMSVTLPGKTEACEFLKASGLKQVSDKLLFQEHPYQ